jgi:DNA-binding transcriptional LysR family regulator
VAASYAALGVKRDIAGVVPTFTAAAALVAATDYVASLPASLVDVLGARLGVRAIATPLTPVTTTINLLWHERTDQDLALRAFRDVVTRAAARLLPARTRVASGRRVADTAPAPNGARR